MYSSLPLAFLALQYIVEIPQLIFKQILKITINLSTKEGQVLKLALID